MPSGSFENSRLYQTIKNGISLFNGLVIALPISIAITFILWIVIKIIEKKCQLESKIRQVIIQRKRWILAFVFYISLLVQMGILSREIGSTREIVLIPFKTPGGSNLIFLYSLANLVIFIPFGIIVPKVFHSINKVWKMLLVTLATSIAIEAIQYILACGTSEVEDVIMNVAGGIVGYLIIRVIYNKKESK